MALKKRKCKVCKEEFTQSRPLQTVCSWACATQFAKKKEQEKRKAETRRMKEDLKTYGDWLKDLQFLVNRIVRVIDYGSPCMSCGKVGGKAQAGHYHSVGSNPQLRFHFMNIWLQDYRCNVELSANIPGYNKGLFDSFGKETKEFIEFGLTERYQSNKWHLYEIKNAIKECKKILKELPKDKIYTIEERYTLRNEFNKRLGLYR